MKESAALSISKGGRKGTRALTHAAEKLRAQICAGKGETAFLALSLRH